MKTRLGIGVGTVMIFLALAPAIWANPIGVQAQNTGDHPLAGPAKIVRIITAQDQIGLSGEVVLNSDSLATATMATFHLSTVTYDSGVYGGVSVGTTVNWSSRIRWNPANNPVILWQFVSGPWTYGFKVTSIHLLEQSNSGLTLSGVGFAYITGNGSPYISSLADWSLRITPDGSSSTGYRFSFDDPLRVPDGGMTAGLLAAAFWGLKLLGKKKLEAFE